MGAGLAPLKWESRLGAVESVDLALLVDGRDHAMGGAAHTETDGVINFFGELRIMEAFELLGCSDDLII